jgi:hypothetical protein
MDHHNYHPPKVIPNDLAGLMARGEELRAETNRLIEKLSDAEERQRVIRIEMRANGFDKLDRRRHS